MKPEIIWLIAAATLAVYEAYALFTGQETLSRAVWDAKNAEYGAVIPFLVGFLCGHWFWGSN